MAQEHLLTLLKLDLQNPPDVMDDFLRFLIDSAANEIASKGINLTGSSEDEHLIVMYASWLYRKRSSDKGMPRMLKYALHSRLVAEKGGSDDVTG